MADKHSIDIDKYRYTLPEDRIAKYPLADRDRSKLLYYTGEDITHHTFNELPDLLDEHKHLVFNNTRVIQARLEFRKPSGARIEIFCLEPLDPPEYEQAFQSVGACSWRCLVGNAKKWKEGPVFLKTGLHGSELIMTAMMSERFGDSYRIDFSWNKLEFGFGQIIDFAGKTPIPPYLDRDAEDSDKERYQTVYGRYLGSVAAPTAGLHFTNRMMDRLDQKGIHWNELTLHVGAGTFVPVKEQNARHHNMHAEQVNVSLPFLEKWASEASGVIAVGTTSTRSLESLYWLGVRLCSGESLDPAYMDIVQWQDETLPQDISLNDSLHALLGFLKKHGLSHMQFSTQLMITPGYTYRTINGLITNFHLPGSTLLLLIAALIGDDWRRVYNEAMQNHYRFLSYGDSSLLIPRNFRT